MIPRPAPSSRRLRSALLAFVLALLAGASVLVGSAAAAEQPIDFFGGSGSLGGQFSKSGGVAVNEATGDIYVTDTVLTQGDSSGNRIERFVRNPSDNSYSFVSAWGAGVDSSQSGAGYEICTVAANCQQGVASAADGGVSFPLFSRPGVVVDQDTGDVYVADPGNLRVNVYSASGVFLRSMGFGVDQTTGGTGYQVCPASDACQAGVAGSAPGQLAVPGDPSSELPIAVSPPDGNSATGDLYIADAGNGRVEVWPLDGSAPSSIGSVGTFSSGQPHSVAVDSRGIVYAGDGSGAIDRYDTTGADGGGIGFLAPIAVGVSAEQQLTVDATAGTYTLTFTPPGGGAPETTAQLPYNAPARGVAGSVEQALAALPGIGVGQVQVTPSGSASGFPYTILFNGGLGSLSIGQLTAANGSPPLSGGAGASVTNTSPGQFGALNVSTGGDSALAVDPQTDELYALRDGLVQQFGPTNPAGLLAPPTADDGRHGTAAIYDQNGNPNRILQSDTDSGLATEAATGRLYVAGRLAFPDPTQTEPGVVVLGAEGPPPTASLDSCDPPAATAVTCHATINPNGPPDTSYQFEYSTDDVNWSVEPSVSLGSQTTAQSVSGTIDAAPAGLEPNTVYHVRVVAQRNLAPPVDSNELTVTTAPAAPIATTTGAPVWSATTARLTGRVTPENAATTYHFEYGTSTSYGQVTPDQSAGSGGVTELVAQNVSGLAPGTTYHFRLVASNGTAGASGTGADMTVTTRSSDTPLSHGPYPGPPGSDRAYELVSIADSSGNPVGLQWGFSVSGDAAAYSVAGGTPISDSGSLFSIYYASRPAGAHPASGWQTSLLTPPRAQLESPQWTSFYGRSDLGAEVSYNSFPGLADGPLWLLRPGVPAERLFEPQFAGQFGAPPGGGSDPEVVSADASRVVAELQGGSLDPAYPQAASVLNLYDVSSGSPRLLSLLPGPGGGLPARCGTDPLAPGSNGTGIEQLAHPISDDGSRLFFTSAGNNCSGASQLYMRDIPAGVTTLVSGPAVSGPTCGVTFLKGVPGAAFFATATRLDPADTAPTGCSQANENVYRYDESDGSLRCLTCLRPGLPLDSGAGLSLSSVSVADDGSRIYFSAVAPLVPGAGPNAGYRLDVATGALAAIPGLYVQGATDTAIGDDRQNLDVSPDGRFVAFASSAAALNPLGGTADNGGNVQDYLYDDADGSVICVSCAPDGSPTPYGVDPDNLLPEGATSNRKALPGLRALADDGTFAFATPTALVPSDTNAAGGCPEISIATYERACTDVYEWRDGRPMLVTDGTTEWASAPEAAGIDPSGNDVFFVAAAQLTPDAIDANLRLYDARIGGGIDFPPASAGGCSSDCQGSPTAAPGVPIVGTITFSASGNVTPPGLGRVRLAGRRSVRGSRFALRVRVPAAGMITGAGHGVTAPGLRAARPGTYVLEFKLTRRAVRSLRHRHVLRVVLRVSYLPWTGSGQHATFTLSFRQPSHRRGGAR